MEGGQDRNFSCNWVVAFKPNINIKTILFFVVLMVNEEEFNFNSSVIEVPILEQL